MSYVRINKNKLGNVGMVQQFNCIQEDLTFLNRASDKVVWGQ